ncbi:VanZ family protein [Frigoribacterium sp. CFBP9039]|uniref:VanZ family protein n=1 Tax=Frigoribacterium sp. CFBP9029 TaxID=3096541 RepID=UPI002A6A5603|nr:VanZ family protein [Frigoribacterium sp. CFBP9039]MDY0947198.1 VanZ family protein [Frigoribacterium sp. CFBP9039]
MISTFLVEHAPLVRIGFWVAVAAATLLAWVLHRLRLRRVLLGLSAVALIAVLVLTLLPDGARPGGVTCTVQFSVPFQGIETLANVAMLLPLVLFLGAATNRPLTILTGAVALSAVIEVVQALTPVLGRRCDTNDWAMNTVGAVLGAVIALVICAIDRRRRATASSG